MNDEGAFLGSMLILTYSIQEKTKQHMRTIPSSIPGQKSLFVERSIATFSGL